MVHAKYLLRGRFVEIDLGCCVDFQFLEILVGQLENKGHVVVCGCMWLYVVVCCMVHFSLL